MTERLREQLSALDGEFLAVSVECLDLDVFGAFGNTPLSGEGQAALETLLLAAERDDLGIDQLDHTLADVDDHHSAQQSDLRRGKSHAVCLVHGLRHVVEQNSKLFVKLLDGAAFFG